MGNVARTSEDQGAIQRPHFAKNTEIAFGIKKLIAGHIEENIDGVVVFRCSGWALKWVTLKHRCMRTLIRRAMQIEVRVLLEGDTCRALVRTKVPKGF